MSLDLHDARESLAASIQRMLSQKSLRSIDSVSVQKIIDDAHVSRPTFYKYFRDKYDLINWVFYSKAEAAFTETNLKANEGDPFQDVLRTIRGNPIFYSNIIHTESPNGFPEYLYLYFCLNFARLAYKKWDLVDYPATPSINEIFAGQDSETVFTIVYNARGCSYGIVSWIMENYRTPPEKLSGFIQDNISLSLRRLIPEFNS